MVLVEQGWLKSFKNNHFKRFFIKKLVLKIQDSNDFLVQNFCSKFDQNGARQGLGLDHPVFCSDGI
jgi:hypothetical protein